jgi:hypothetical protein
MAGTAWRFGQIAAKRVSAASQIYLKLNLVTDRKIDAKTSPKTGHANVFGD